MTYYTQKGSVDQLIQELEPHAAGRKITTHQVDMVSHRGTKSNSVYTRDSCPQASDIDLTRLYAEIKAQHGQGPDILVANAGYGKRVSDILDIDVAEWDYTINVNLRASFVLTKLAVAHMKEKQWGRIIYISSIAAGGTSINGCHYSASKAGIQGLSKNLAIKLAKDGITCNDVAPAMITGTGMIPDEDFLKGTPGDVKNIPVGRAGSTQECANVVTMLAKTGYMTGQSILLSGGLK